MQQKGGLRKTLIGDTYRSVLFQYSGGKYYEAAVLLKTLSNFLGVKLPGLPITQGRFKLGVNYISYCEHNLPLISSLVDQWLKEHAAHSNIIDVEEGEHSSKEEDDD